MGVKISGNIKRFLIAQGTDPDVVDTLVDTLISELNNQVSFSLDFKDNGTVVTTDTEGEVTVEAWSVEGDMMTITEADGTSYVLKYEINGNKLSLVFDTTGLASILESSDAEEQAFIALFLKGLLPSSSTSSGSRHPGS